MRRTSRRSALKFIITVAILSFPISAIFDSSTIILNRTEWYIGAAVVLFIVVFGAVFDMLGVAAAAARETPFHAMASKRVFGAKRAISIVRNAEKVSSICNDVVGDIAGVLSGAGALAVSVQLVHSLHGKGWLETTVSIGLTAFITAITIGIKAVGKTLAISSPTPIILVAARIVDTLWFFPVNRKRNRRGVGSSKK